MIKACAVALTLLLIVCTSVFSNSPSPVHMFDNCSCTAPDNSCNASVTCQGGCIAQCPNNGGCYARCSGFYQRFAMETNIQMQNANYSQLVTELSRVTGEDITFSPIRPGTVFNADYKRSVLWDVLESLSDQGTVQFAGQDFEKLKKLRRILLSGERITLCVRSTPVNTFVSDMAGLTGVPLRITAGSPMRTVNAKFYDVTLQEMLDKVSEQTGTRIIKDAP